MAPVAPETTFDSDDEAAEKEDKEYNEVAVSMDLQGQKWYNFKAQIAYRLENAIAADPNVRFYLLTLLSAVACVVLGMAWENVSNEEGTQGFAAASFMSFMVILTGDYNTDIVKEEARVVYMLMVLAGITVVAVNVGLVTDSVNHYMKEITAGSTNVVERGHTLILGWNESSIRLICQLAFLRRVYLVQNEVWYRRLFPWLRVPPSTPVAQAPIVILNNGDKQRMEENVTAAFFERGVKTGRTKVGRDVVFRKGDPTRALDLVRVAAYKATSILLLMNEQDVQEKQNFASTAENSASIRCLLALRSVLFSAYGKTLPKYHETDLRIVVQLSHQCDFVNAMSFVATNGRRVLYPRLMHRNINALLFHCSSRPGLSRIIMCLLDFQGEAIRTRRVDKVRAGPKGELGWFAGKKVKDVLLTYAWSDAILIGFDDSQFNVFDGEDDEDFNYNAPGAAGIMGDPERVIQPDDAAVFISKSSTPTPDLTRRGYADEARAIEKEYYVPTKGPGGKMMLHKDLTINVADDPSHILLLGWREQWSTDIEELVNRLMDIGSKLAGGSTLTMVNKHAYEEMDALLMAGDAKHFARVGSKGWALSGLPGVTMLNFTADPIKYREVQPLFQQEREYETAIILGTVAKVDQYSTEAIAPNVTKDSRILSTLLILRELAHKNNRPIHCIAESHQHQTPGLALCPTNEGRGYEPDFIDTQEIIARSLAMNIAYPQIQDALSELINTERCTPEIDFINPRHLGIKRNQRATLGCVQELLFKTHKARGVAIGYQQGNKLFFAPVAHLPVTWTKQHRIVLICRHLDDATSLPPRKQLAPHAEGALEESCGSSEGSA